MVSVTKKYFFCYSFRLKEFLTEKTIRFEFTGNNQTNNKPYWVYIRNDYLADALSEWSKLNGVKTKYNEEEGI